MNQEIISYLKNLCGQLVEGCKTQAYDGTFLYTPDGVSSYNALWLRDFSYMAEYCGFAIPNRDLIGCIEYAIRHRREDGWMPDRACGDGTGVYAAGEAGAPIGEANLDNTPFLIFTVYSLYERIKEEDFSSLFLKWEPLLTQGMALIPADGTGLVYNDPQKPHSPYGFTDTVCKTGRLFMESLLVWRACRMMEILCTRFGTGSSSLYKEKADRIERSIHLLRDEETGIYFAADKDCRQLDIWGNAYMLYIGFPCDKADRQNILDFLVTHYDEYMYCGQVRHLLKGEYWQRLLINVPEETYQNGAYWATATGWIIWCLAQSSYPLAIRTITEALDYFKKEGSFECVNEGYRKLESFVVSAANVYGGAVRSLEDERFAASMEAQGYFSERRFE